MNNKITFSQKTLELLYNIKKIIKDNLNVVSDAKTVKNSKSGVYKRSRYIQLSYRYHQDAI